MTTIDAIEKHSKLSGVKPKTIRKRLLIRSSCTSEWLHRKPSPGVTDPNDLRKCRINGEDISYLEAYRRYCPAKMSQGTFVRRMERLPEATSDELLLPTKQFKELSNSRNPISQRERENRRKNSKLPPVNIEVDGSVLTVDQAALYIARMTAKADITLCKIGKRIETFLTGRHYGSRYDIGTFRRATPEMIRAEIV